MSQDSNRPLPSQEQLEAWLEEWKPILSLQAWEINIKIKTAKFFQDTGIAAQVEKNIPGRDATIYFNSEADWEDVAASLTWEEVLVHELIHCVTDPGSWDLVRENVYTKMLYEQGINDLARALMTVKRAGKKDEHGS